MQMSDTDPSKTGFARARCAPGHEEAQLSAEEHRYEVNLEFVEDTGGKGELRHNCGVNEHILVACAFRLGHRGTDVR
jgi:hypothetical protein